MAAEQQICCAAAIHPLLSVGAAARKSARCGAHKPVSLSCNPLFDKQLRRLGKRLEKGAKGALETNEVHKEALDRDLTWCAPELRRSPKEVASSRGRANYCANNFLDSGVASSKNATVARGMPSPGTRLWFVRKGSVSETVLGSVGLGQSALRRAGQVRSDDERTAGSFTLPLVVALQVLYASLHDASWFPPT
jgi:hypothetical protein